MGERLPMYYQNLINGGDGFIKCGNDDVVTWCVGHLLEQAEPDAYDPKFKQWRLEHLPIIPENGFCCREKKSKNNFPWWKN